MITGGSFTKRKIVMILIGSAAGAFHLFPVGQPPSPPAHQEHDSWPLHLEGRVLQGSAFCWRVPRKAIARAV
jgi:hypothetical protein